MPDKDGMLEADDFAKFAATFHMIREDVENDIKGADGKPLTGPLVAELFANQGAAIFAIAGILEKMCQELANPEHWDD
jgi:hypothetical protein